MSTKRLASSMRRLSVSPRFELAALGDDEAEDYGFALEDEAQGVQTYARARVIVFGKKPSTSLVEQGLNDEVVAALGDPRAVAATHVV